MTIMQPAIIPKPRYFPSRIALLAAGELVFIAMLLRWSNSPSFFAAAVVCSLCALQLGVLLINRFTVDTRKIRRVARTAEFSRQAVLITDADGRIKWTNPHFTRLTGFYLSEISGKTFSMILHGRETQNATVEKIRRHVRLGQPFEVEILQYNRDGETLWVSARGEAIRDTRGRLTHYVIAQTDISDQHRLMEEMVKTCTSFDPIIESAKSEKVADLTRQLETLSADDDRRQLQAIVDGLNGGVEQCVASLPAATETATAE
jgi:PAS domain S-box-containing protein